MNHINFKLPKTIGFSTLAFLFAISNVSAQSGNFIQIWGGPQYVGIENFNDYSGTSLSGQQNIVQTYKVGAGLDYIHNFNPNYGLQTGLYYSGVGQKYNGLVKDFETHDTVAYTSHVYMDYIRIPFLLRFNSEIEENEKLNMSIYMGFQLGYLMDVKASTSPGPPQGMVDTFMAQNPHFNFKQLYNPIDFGLTAGAQFNYKIRDWEYVHIGIRFDRSITNIENENYVLPGNAPVEYLYPVSTKKEQRQSHNDILAGYSSQYISLNLYVGMSFMTKKITPPPHVIRDDDNSQ